MTLAFVPRKSIAVWSLKGYRQVPGYEAPKGWAVLMEHVGYVVPVEAERAPEQHCPHKSNIGRSRYFANRSRQRVPA
jgi:hypothetical protein